MNSIVLCGFMGCGKTTVGKALSKQLNMPFIDTDEEIVKREGRSIAEIFSADGEEHFRSLETELIAELSKTENIIISLGGGLAANSKNHPFLKKCGKVILLDCGIEETLKRISGDKSRPLTSGGKEDIINRYNARKPIYEAVADVTIDSSKDIDATVKQILEMIGEK